MVTLLVLSIGPYSFGKEEKKDLPARGISVYPEYTGVLVSKGEDVSIDLVVTNYGRRDENINLTVTSIPKGWKAKIKTYNFGVTGIHVKSDSSKNLALKAEPDASVGPGKYTFGIKGQTEDRTLTSLSHVVVTVTEKKKGEKKTAGIDIITSYPVLKGPTDAKFEFSLEVENKLDKDSIFNLSSQGPKDWEINFKPAYEEKYISSLRLKAGQSKTVAVEVTPYLWAAPGEYPILVKVNSPEAKGEVALTLVLTGTYKLEVGTANGLLSLNAIRGKEANLSLYVKNSGSGTLNNLQFLSVKPENWKVEYSPEKIDALAPEELKQVEVTITPAVQALVGDYLVGLNIEAGKVSKAMELRVTVGVSTAWAWIGIAIIGLVVVGLGILFIRLGRR
jgi:uncharacterized membrane protein